MKQKNYTPLLVCVVALFLLLFIFVLTHIGNLVVLFPVGLIALQERTLIVTAMTIMLAVAIPVVIGTFFVAWKYRAENTKATYMPDWTGNFFIKSLWWGLLIALVFIFSYIVWVAAHQLDPYKPIDATVKPMTIEVVALQWKWLFLYPQQHIATVNFIAFPVGTPINFHLTADAPMTSFWIPSLGSQIYAMASMETKLHLLSDKTGDFPGGTTEINGAGYAGMRFTARVVSQNDFATWVQTVKKSKLVLNGTAYKLLATPSQDTPVAYYATFDPDLYNSIITKYMKPKIQVHE